MSPASQQKLVYLLAALVLALAIAISTPVEAQSPAPTPCDVDAAQEWYDGLDSDDILQSSFSTAIDTDARTSARFGAIEDISTLRDGVAEAEVPACIERARDWYVDGLDYLVEALNFFVDDETGTFAVQFGAALGYIGNMRGYVAALGVEINEPEDTYLFFK